MVLVGAVKSEPHETWAQAQGRGVSKLPTGNGTGKAVLLSDDMGYQEVGQRW